MLLLYQGIEEIFYKLTYLSEDLLKCTSHSNSTLQASSVTPSKLCLAFDGPPHCRCFSITFCPSTPWLMTKHIQQINNQAFNNLLLRCYQPLISKDDDISSSGPWTLHLGTGIILLWFRREFLVAKNTLWTPDWLICGYHLSLSPRLLPTHWS